MVLSLLVNGVLDLGFGVGWWIVKKMTGSVYDLAGSLFFEKVTTVKETELMKIDKLIELLEHDLVEIKHTQDMILHRLEDEDDGKDNDTK